MPINEWSESILIADLNDEPTLSDDLDALVKRLEASDGTAPDVIANMQGVTYINSSNIAQLLRIRKMLSSAGARLRICAVNDAVWSVILTTGLDKVFEFTDDVSTSLASLQIGD
jgi:anti-anti-sigma factor